MSMRKITAILAAAVVMTMTISCASSGQPAGGTSEGQETSAAQETVREQAPSAAAVQDDAATAQETGTAAAAREAATAATAQETDTAATAREAATAAAAQETDTAATAREAAAAAAAQEAAPDEEIPVEKIEALFGEGGPLYGIFPEGTDTEAIAGAAREQMDIVNRQFSRAIEEIVEKSESESVDFDQESLQKFAEGLLGQFIGSRADGNDAGGFDFDSLDAMIEARNAIIDSEKEYVIDHNSGSMESGDVQIVASDVYHEDDDYEQEEFRMLSNMIQNNYRMDDENQLWLVDSSEDVILFTHERGQDGGYSIKDAVFAEKGDNYMSSVEALLIETGESVDDLEETLETSRVFVLYDLKNYLEEHPGVKGIEYEGEIRTAEELDQIWNIKLDELYDKYGDGSSSEETAADSGTNTAPAAE